MLLHYFYLHSAHGLMMCYLLTLNFILTYFKQTQLHTASVIYTAINAKKKIHIQTGGIVITLSKDFLVYRISVEIHKTTYISAYELHMYFPEV